MSTYKLEPLGERAPAVQLDRAAFSLQAATGERVALAISLDGVKASSLSLSRQQARRLAALLCNAAEGDTAEAVLVVTSTPAPALRPPSAGTVRVVGK